MELSGSVSASPAAADPSASRDGGGSPGAAGPAGAIASLLASICAPARGGSGGEAGCAGGARSATAGERGLTDSDFARVLSASQPRRSSSAAPLPAAVDAGAGGAPAGLRALGTGFGALQASADPAAGAAADPSAEPAAPPATSAAELPADRRTGDGRPPIGLRPAAAAGQAGGAGRSRPADLGRARSSSVPNTGAVPVRGTGGSSWKRTAAAAGGAGTVPLPAGPIAGPAMTEATTRSLPATGDPAGPRTPAPGNPAGGRDAQAAARAPEVLTGAPPVLPGAAAGFAANAGTAGNSTAAEAAAGPASAAPSPVLGPDSRADSTAAPAAGVGQSGADLAAMPQLAPAPNLSAAAPSFGPDPAGAGIASGMAAETSGWAPEKIAARSGSSARGADASEPASDKKSLSIDFKMDTPAKPGLGTSGAESQPAMHSPASPHRFFPDLPSAGAGGTMPGGLAGAGSGSSGTDAASAGATARHAVETVVKLADAQALRTEAGSHAVSLGFKFGSDHLAVRVELRDGQVRTQFTTDSSELRAALSSEWQAFTADSSGRRFHFADPVFSAPDGQATGSGTGRGAAREPSESAWADPGPADPAPADGESGGPAGGTVPLATAGRLHTFA